MSEPYPRVRVKEFPRVAARGTAEDRFWRRLQDPVVVKEFAAVTGIDFNPVAPHDFAVSSSTRVQIYGADRCTVKKSITRFTDLAYSKKERKKERKKKKRERERGGEKERERICECESRR